MPELPEVLVWLRLIKKRRFRKLLFYLLISPLAFSLGSTKRAYVTLTANQRTHHPQEAASQVPQWVSSQRASYGSWPPQSWRNRAANENWGYLLDDTPPGQLICARRGKLLLIACGYHAMVISFGLEAHLLTMSPEVFWEIITRDIPGSNPDKSKAENMRTFVIPERFTVKGSSTSSRTIRILAAFVSEKHVVVLCDFCGLARMHVESRNVPWTEEDFEVGSQAWNYMFRQFKGGPDWIVERNLAERALKSWQENIRKEYAAYLTDLEVHREGIRQSRTLPEFGFLTTAKRTEPPPPAPPMRPIIKEMYNNSGGAFSGFGRHLVNDFLFNAAIHPGTPAISICEDDETFAELLEGIPEYLERFTVPQFYKPMASSCVPGRDNPFEFNEDSNRHYMQQYIDVFRRCSVHVPKELYEKYLTKGLLDSAHTIGQPYSPEKQENFFKTSALNGLKPLQNIGESTIVNVNRIGKPLKAYTIVRAKVPEEWMLTSMSYTAVKKDIASFVHATTIGPNQFRELTLNRVVNPTVKRDGGRPGKIRRGEGRPRKSKPTKKSLVNSAPQVRKRVLAMCDPDGEPSEDDDHDSDSDEADDEDKYYEDIEAAPVIRWSLPEDRVGSIIDYLPFVIQSPEFQSFLYRNSMISLPEATTTVIVRKANGPLRIEKRTLRSKFYSRDDVLQAARRVVAEESPDLDFDHLGVTALKWTRGILNYHLAKALLDKGDDAITDAQIAPFLSQCQPTSGPGVDINMMVVG